MSNKNISVRELSGMRDSIKKSQLENASGNEIRICMGGGCIASGSTAIKNKLEEVLKENNISDVTIRSTGCLGPCSKGPVMVMMKDDTFYQDLKVDDIEEIVSSHVQNGQVVERLLNHDDKNGKVYTKTSEIDFLRKQTKVVLRNCGSIDPTKIEEYIGNDGYQALAKTLTLQPDDVISEMKDSGLRGRGGAGFPTYLKWQFAKNNEARTKFILCNADEGDPGAYMDRSLLEGDPHSLIEGMSIGAFAIGANQGYVYVRAEYPLAVERLKMAIKQAEALGLLGDNILGTGFKFNLGIRMGSGAFVCGEETALIASIEGKRGEPRPRPPFPAESGLWDMPTVLNNVETYANVAEIINKTGKVFAQYGTEKSKGTKVFALAGAIKNSGLVEVPVGSTLGDLLYDIGGGTSSGKPFKAAQIGGPSGGCIPKQHLNVPLDYESLNELGAIMGSGGLIVMDDDSCMVDVARFFLEFVQEESCGKCVPCRVGTKRMSEILERICKGKGVEGDIEKLIDLGESIKTTALCGLGQSAPNPVLSTIRYFRNEYEDHIKQKHCDAGVCPDLVRAPCQSACPANVDVPGFVSLIGEKRYAEALKLHRERNPFAAVCARVCFHSCETKCKRSTIDEPVSIRAVKRFMVDQEITLQVPDVVEDAEKAQRQIAIIGAGPSGLSCAYFLARLGYKPKVFEAEQRPGGMLVQTIPAYRLPREVLAREIRMIEGMGVDIETGKRLGKDFTLASLKEEGFEVVYVAVGAPKGISLNLPGHDADGVMDSLRFLQTYNLRGSVPVKKQVVIVGGGNAAIDAARTAVRLGSEEVTMVYRRTQAEMTAYAEEIEEAIQEGVIIKTLTNPLEILKGKDGSVIGVKCMHMKLGDFDKSGRRRPEEDASTFVIDAQQVILAIGQTLDCHEILNGTDVKTQWGSQIKASEMTGQTNIPWVFAGGDSVQGPSSVIEAVGDGEKAAVGMDVYLSGKENAFWRTERENDTHFDPDADPAKYQRQKVSLLPLERRVNNFDEVEMAWVEGDAVKQAKRCLRCDYGKSKK